MILRGCGLRGSFFLGNGSRDAGAAPCTRVVVGCSTGCCRRCALHPRGGWLFNGLLQALRPAPAWWSAVQRAVAGAAPCTRAGGQPPAPPLGPLHIPKPLAMIVFGMETLCQFMPKVALMGSAFPYIRPVR
jgi:hypothetical protein